MARNRPGIGPRIIELKDAGLPITVIAQRLNVSFNSVKHHLRRVNGDRWAHGTFAPMTVEAVQQPRRLYVESVVEREARLRAKAYRDVAGSLYGD